MKIFATDVHRGSLEHATRGRLRRGGAGRRLARSAWRATSPRIGERYQVVPELRQLIVFAQHNVIKDAPFTRVDLITCRNLLIYLQPAGAAEGALAVSLRAQPGRLPVPGAERDGRDRWPTSFETLDKHWRIYRKRSDARIPVDARLAAAAA